MKSNATGLEWKWVDWKSMPERPVDKAPTPDRSYNKEELNWQSGTWVPEGKADSGAGAPPAPQPVVDLYSGLWRSIVKGAPQEITPQSVRHRVGLIEKIRKYANLPIMN